MPGAINPTGAVGPVGSPANLARCRAGVAASRDGQRDSKWLIIGDSQVAGIGSTGFATQPDNGSLVTRLATCMTAMGVPAVRGFSAPGNNNFWTTGASWTASFFGFASLACFTSPAGGNALVYADPRINADRFDVYVLQGAGMGTVNITATGGTTVSQSMNGATGVVKLTATAAAKATTNSVSITATVGQVYVVGVEPFDSTTSKIRIANAGIGTVGAVEHIAAPGTWGTIPMINAYAPDLTVINLSGVNDRGNGRSFSQFTAAMDQLVNAALKVSSVIIATEMPTGVSPNNVNEPQWNAYAFTRQECMVYDYWSRCVSFENYNARGMVYDFLHANNLGYWDFAQGLASGLVANL
jgi:hypothetical protein